MSFWRSQFDRADLNQKRKSKQKNILFAGHSIGSVFKLVNIQTEFMAQKKEHMQHFNWHVLGDLFLELRPVER